MTSRLGAFAAICRRSFMVRHVRNNLNQRIAFIHSSAIRFDEPIEIKMPSLSPTMTEGTIVKWLKKEGDVVSPGDVICEIQTDKAIVGFEVEEEGVLLKILMPEDSKNVQLGEIIAVIGSEGSTYEGPSTPKKVETKKVSTSESIPSVSPTIKLDFPKLIGPSVRKLLEEYDIKHSEVSSSGPQKNVLKADVLSHIRINNLKPKPHETKPLVLDQPVKEHVPKPSVSLAFTDVPLSSMRKTIAQRLSHSKSTIPHAYIGIDCNIDKILQLRKSLKKDNISVSVNDFVIKSVASALFKVPKMNVINSNNVPQISQSIDISIAVATENGLITPIVKNANTLSIQEINEEVKLLASKAREGRLKLEEFQGGSFTISNLGMFGIKEFSAVINPPQGAILAVGGTKLVAKDDKPVQQMNVTLSFDCRIIDDYDAGQFLQVLKGYLENPLNILF